MTEEVLERETLYVTEDFTVFKDGGLYNKKEQPLMNIIYEMGKALHNKEKMVEEIKSFIKTEQCEPCAELYDEEVPCDECDTKIILEILESYVG